MTLVCVPILVHDPASALADAQAAKLAGADLVEFRIDEFYSGEPADANDPVVRGLLRLVADSPLPCIVTCRAASEGGHYDADDDARVSLNERLGTASGPGERPPRYLDVEYATYARSKNIEQKINLAVDHPAQLRDLRTSLILSAHDFITRPADLMRRFARMNAEPAAAVLKIAYRARSLRDSLELLDLPRQAAKPMIALGMGEFGLMSRILAPKFGGFLTFASLRPTTTTAPGQPTIRELLDTYRFRSINEGTRVYGVVGWPVGHSLSPLVHNAGFERASLNAVYVPLPIGASDDAEASYASFKGTLLELIEHPRLDFRGCSVTLPHKENLARLAREMRWTLDDVTSATGAANTLVMHEAPMAPMGKVVEVLNTDAPAASECLREVLGDLAGKRVALLGAGGVARSIAFALAHAGASVIVYNRSPARAQRLAADLAPNLSPNAGKIVPAAWDALPKTCADALINGTPVGMTTGPAPNESPAPLAAMNACPRDLVVMDTVYNPIETPLLREARRLNFRAIDGVGMFVRQAALQFEAWTYKRPPLALFDRIVRESLGPRRDAAT